MTERSIAGSASSLSIYGSDAAMYVRMSTERQNYSIDHQRARIQVYAADHGLRIVTEYADEGKSGLDIKRRAGLQRLIDDVQAGTADFSVIIVYDVTRWGRFQDVDEAAYYEHLCRRAGIRVIYCEEQFQNDGSPLASLLKSIKRTMAAEYSRELSAKVFRAQCRFVQMGFKQGGHAGYGLRRLTVAQNGVPKRVLEYGEQKGSTTDRVVLVLGPNHEVATVKRVYALYLDDGLSEAAIARLLNAEQVVSEFGRPWTQGMVNSLLTNLKYIGSLVYNRRSCKLTSARVRNDPRDWIINIGAVVSLLGRELFDMAQAERVRRNRRYLPDELLALLKACYQTHGNVTADIVRADRSMPDPQLFVRCFGSLLAAYDQAGLPRTRLHGFIETKRHMLSKQKELFSRARGLAEGAGAQVVETLRPFMLLINGTVRVLVEVSTRTRPKRGHPKWKICPRGDVDFILVGRFDPDTGGIFDHFLLPAADLHGQPLYLKEKDRPGFWHRHSTSLAAFFADKQLAGTTLSAPDI